MLELVLLPGLLEVTDASSATKETTLLCLTSVLITVWGSDANFCDI